jgi:hypothetical protein
MDHSAFSAAVRKGLSCFSRLQSIPYSNPELTPDTWCTMQPCRKVRIASRQFTLTQPTSTVLVYALGVLTTGAGLYFLLIRGDELSRLWWGISLVLWGIGALLAGTSYQAFAYEIKCAGRQSCAWTSWWEVVYLMFQQASMNALLVGVAYSCTEGSWQTLLQAFALASTIAYVVVAFIGALIPIKSLITFNLMVWVSTPALMICLFLNGWRYYSYSNPMDLALLGTWILLLVTSAIYWLYDELDITMKLWRRQGSWFSQNDVLHVCLILWVIYIAAVVANRVRDYTPFVVPG